MMIAFAIRKKIDTAADPSIESELLKFHHCHLQFRKEYSVHLLWQTTPYRSLAIFAVLALSSPRLALVKITLRNGILRSHAKPGHTCMAR